MCKKILLYIIVLSLIVAGWKIIDERSDINACDDLDYRLKFNVINFQLKLYKLTFEITKIDFPEGVECQIPEAEVETTCDKDTNDISIIGQKKLVKKSLREIDCFLQSMGKNLDGFWLSSDRKKRYKRYCSLFNGYRSFFVKGLETLNLIEIGIEMTIEKLDNIIELIDEVEKGVISA